MKTAARGARSKRNGNAALKGSGRRAKEIVKVSVAQVLEVVGATAASDEEGPPKGVIPGGSPRHSSV
jgi:hypothetical protein